MTGMMVIAMALRLSVKRMSSNLPTAPMAEQSDAAVAASLRLYLSASKTTGVQLTMKNTASELAMYRARSAA